MGIGIGQWYLVDPRLPREKQSELPLLPRDKKVPRALSRLRKLVPQEALGILVYPGCLPRVGDA